MHLWVCVDEATKFTVGHVWAEGQQVGNIDGNRVLELLRERWIAVLGRVHTLRTDSEGAWRNKEVHERLGEMQSVWDLHPGEASWQASVTKNTIGIVKDTMTRIALERVGSYQHSGHLDVQQIGDQSFFDSGNETPAPSFLEYLQGMETARDAWLKEHLEQDTGYWHISDLAKRWTSGDAEKAKAHDHTSKAGFIKEQWCWRRARKSTRKMNLENRGKSFGSFTRELRSNTCT